MQNGRKKFAVYRRQCGNATFVGELKFSFFFFDSSDPWSVPSSATFLFYLAIISWFHQSAVLSAFALRSILFLAHLSISLCFLLYIMFSLLTSSSSVFPEMRSVFSSPSSLIRALLSMCRVLPLLCMMRLVALQVLADLVSLLYIVFPRSRYLILLAFERSNSSSSSDFHSRLSILSSVALLFLVILSLPWSVCASSIGRWLESCNFHQPVVLYSIYAFVSFYFSLMYSFLCAFYFA